MIDGAHVVEVREPGRVALRLIVTDRLPIGRDGDGLLLTGDRISRHHCELRVDGDALTASDSGSSNGTFVNGARLGTTERRSLAPGDVVGIGDTIVVVDPPAESDDGATVATAGGLHATVIGKVPSTQASTDAHVAERRTPGAGADSGGTGRGATVQVSGPSPSMEDSLRASVVGGTITMVFSDIVDSTGLNGRLGDTEWFRLLSRHNELFRHQAEHYQGVEVKTQGDGFMLTFPSARHALLFGISVQRDLEAERQRDESFVLHVRIGVHTGEVIRDAGDLFGRHVNLAARVAAKATADEIVASALVHDLASPMGDVRFGPVRRVLLKGFEGERSVYPVPWR